MTTFEAILGVITMLAAFYGVVLSTTLYLRDRAAITVQAELALVSGLGGFTNSLVMRAINIGRRPVYFRSKPVIVLDNGYHLFFKEMENPPGRIDEGEVYEAFVELKELDKALKENGDPLPVGVLFRDSIGRRHYCKFKKGQWANIEKEIESLKQS